MKLSHCLNTGVSYVDTIPGHAITGIVSNTLKSTYALIYVLNHHKRLILLFGEEFSSSVSCLWSVCLAV